MSPESVSFDRAAAYYDETRGFPPGEDVHAAALIRDAAGLTTASRVIEVGIGTGRIALPLAKLVRSVAGIDISRAMLDRLRGKQLTEPVQVVEGDATRLPFADRCFDAAVGVHIFHLIPSWKEAIAEVQRVLRPGGLLIDASNGASSYEPLWEIWNQRRPQSRAIVGVGFGSLDTFLIEEGWQQLGEARRHDYTFMQAPQVFLDQLASRVWSSTWKWSDEELTACLALMQNEIRERFGDPHNAAQLTGSFHVRVFLPPQK